MLKCLVRAGALALFLAPAVAAADACDISDLPCAQDGGKCNIHFQNRTGLAEKSCNGNYTSYGAADTVNVRAKDDQGNTLGNVLKIAAGAKATMNLSSDKKANFSRIKTSGHGAFDGTSLTCDQIRTVLRGTGKCKVRTKKDGIDGLSVYGRVIFDCDGGNFCTKR